MTWTDVRFTSAAHKHGISEERVTYVLRHPLGVFDEPASVDPKWETDRLLVLGDDPRGVPLEIVGIELDDGAFLVMHAMKLRSTYQSLYERAIRGQTQ